MSRRLSSVAALAVPPPRSKAPPTAIPEHEGDVDDDATAPAAAAAAPAQHGRRYVPHRRRLPPRPQAPPTSSTPTHQPTRSASRKSFGTAYSAAPSTSAAGSAAASALASLTMASMYSTVIKLSAENKITAANTWSLPLIDHMESLLQLNPPAGGKPTTTAATKPTTAPAPTTAAKPATTAFNARAAAAEEEAAMLNFQRASCALDASIKIYASRVDDTYSTSYRVLDSLSRSGPPPPSATTTGADGDGADGETAGTGGKGSRARAAVAAATADSTTLERNLASITLSNLEAGSGGARVAVDALAHKLAAGYDEAGVAGLFLHRLVVAPDASVAFDCLDADDVDVMPGAGWYTDVAAVDDTAAVVMLPADAVAPLRAIVADTTAPTTTTLAPSMDALRADIAAYSATIGQSPLTATAAALAAVAPSLLAPTTRGGAPAAGGAGDSVTASAVDALPIPAAIEDAEGTDGEGESDGAGTENDAWALVVAQRDASTTAAAVMSDGGALDFATFAARGDDAAPASPGDDYDVGGGGADDDDDGGGVDYAAAADGGGMVTPQRVRGSEGVNMAALAAAVNNAHLPLAAAAALSHTPFKVGGRAAGHWKLRATAAAAVVAANAAAAADGADAPVVVGKAKRAAGGAKKKAAGPVVNTDLLAPLPATTFVKATVKAPSARAVGARKAAAASADAVADSEMLSAAAVARATAAGHLAHVIPAALWGADIVTGTLVPRVADAAAGTAAPHGLSSGPLQALLTLSSCPSLPLRPAVAPITDGAAVPPLTAALAALVTNVGTSGLPSTTPFGAPGSAVAGGYDAVDGPDDDDDCAGDFGGGMFDAQLAAAAAAPAADGTPARPDVSAPAESSTTEGDEAAVPVPPASTPAPEAALSTLLPHDGVGEVRKVERIHIKYDTVAKRVDVAALKTDMWSHLAACDLPAASHKAVEARFRATAAAHDSNLGAAFTDASGAGGGSGSSSKGVPPAAAGGVPFSAAIGHLAPAMSAAVTVPFYFITLLHLANEHGLTLTEADPRGGAADPLADCMIGRLA